MAQPAKSIVLLPNAARTTTGTGNQVIQIEDYTSCIIMLDVSTTPSGTSPTLNVRIQQGILDDGGATNSGDKALGSAVWDDFLSFAQVTATGKRFMRIVGGGNLESASSANALAAGTIRNGPLGSIWRVAWVTGGTNPNFTFDVDVQLIP